MGPTVVGIGVAVGGLLVFSWLLAYLVLRDVPAGEIRLVAWPLEGRRIYRGPTKSKELFPLTSATTISSKLITVELDLSDQVADLDAEGARRSIPVHVMATAIASVGQSDLMVLKAATEFFALTELAQGGTVKGVMTGACRSALNRMTHDELFLENTAIWDVTDELDATDAADAAAEHAPRTNADATNLIPDHPLAMMVGKLCARELADLGLVLRSFNITALQSDVSDARRRRAMAEARADADIAIVAQTRRTREAELDSERIISERERDLAQARAHNSALIAEATARQQEIQARADAERVRIEAEAAQQALRGAQFGLALDEALRITKIAASQAEGFRKVNNAIRDGEDSFFRYRLIEMLPQLTPAIAHALASAKVVSGGGAGNAAVTTESINSIVQAALAQELGAAKVSPDEAGNGGNGDGLKGVVRKRDRRMSPRANE
jgi:flotillin